MRYMGSKSRYVKDIVPIITNSHDSGNWYVEPFVGGGNLISSVNLPLRWGNDISKSAVGLLSAISKGYVPPNEVSFDLYKLVKSRPEDYPIELVGFCEFCCSFAGKSWGGYARGKSSSGIPRNYAGEQVRNLTKQSEGLGGVRFTSMSYLYMDIPKNSTVYCDPPYEGTTGYSDTFNSETFWAWANELSKKSKVYVSEYDAPEGWNCVWSKGVNSSLTKDTGSKRSTERLFTRVSY